MTWGGASSEQSALPVQGPGPSPLYLLQGLPQGPHSIPQGACTGHLAWVDLSSLLHRQGLEAESHYTISSETPQLVSGVQHLDTS